MTSKILLASANELHLTEQVKIMMKQNGFENLNDLLTVVKLENIVDAPFSNYKVYKEIIDTLSDNGITTFF